MLAQLMRVLVGFCWVACSLLAYNVVDTANVSAPLPASGTVTVLTWSGTESAEALRSDLTQFARSEKITLGQVVPDLERGRTVRHLYVVAGDPRVGGQWLNSGIGDFGESMRTRVQPLLEGGSRTPIGNWFVFSEPDTIALVAEFFTSHGARTATNIEGGAPPSLPYLPGPVQATSWVLALLLVTTTGAFVVSRTRRYAIERLHGAGSARLLAQELRPLALIWGLSGLVVLAGCTIFTLLRYHGAGLMRFLWVTAVLAALMFCALAAALALVLAMITAVDILGALKGRTASAALTLSAYAMRVTAVLVALSLGAGALSLLADRAERGRAEASLDALGNASIVSLGNAYTEADQNELGRVVAPWLRHLDQNGDLIVVLQEDTSTLPVPFAQAGLLVVNSAFLGREPIQLADGHIMDHADGDHVTVVVPADGWSHREALSEALTKELEPVVGPGITRQQWMVRAKQGQTVSTFIVPSQLQGPEVVRLASSMTDPVIVVYPSSLASGYTSGASSGEVLVTDPQAAIAERTRSEGLTRFVRSITPVAERAQQATAEQVAELRNALFSTVMAYLIVIMAGVAATIIYTRKNAQRSLARYLHGWRTAATYPVLISIEGLLLVLLLGWIPWQIFQQRQELAPLNALAPLPGGLPTLGLAEAIAMAVLAVITTGGFWAALLFAHRRITQHGVSEA